jgi:hypothetical protein
LFTVGQNNFGDKIPLLEEILMDFFKYGSAVCQQIRHVFERQTLIKTDENQTKVAQYQSEGDKNWV